MIKLSFNYLITYSNRCNNIIDGLVTGESISVMYSYVHFTNFFLIGGDSKSKDGFSKSGTVRSHLVSDGLKSGSSGPHSGSRVSKNSSVASKTVPVNSKFCLWIL